MSKMHYIIIASILFIFIGIWYLFSVKNGNISAFNKVDVIDTELEISSESYTSYYEQETETEFLDCKVYITGSVKNPGVYSVSEDFRIIDVVEMAGGVLEDASLDNINLAKHVFDEMHIIIPSKDSENNYEDFYGSASLEIYYNASLDFESKNESKGKININTASVNELKELNGIGDVIAENIVEYRNKNGPFKSIDDIKNVSRIGDKLFLKIKDSITV